MTGAASGIGRLMAYKLAGLKPRAIVVWDLSTAENEKTKKEIEKMGVKCIAFTINLAKREAVYEVADATSKGIRALLGDETAYTKDHKISRNWVVIPLYFEILTVNNRENVIQF